MIHHCENVWREVGGNGTAEEVSEKGINLWKISVKFRYMAHILIGENSWYSGSLFTITYVTRGSVTAGTLR